MALYRKVSRSFEKSVRMGRLSGLKNESEGNQEISTKNDGEGKVISSEKEVKK